jgi:hypothetical protein
MAWTGENMEGGIIMREIAITGCWLTKEIEPTISPTAMAS